MNIPWDTIIPIIVDLIAGCLDDESKMTARIQQAGPWDQIRLRFALRKAGFKRDVINAVVAEWCSCCHDASRVTELVQLAAASE